MDVLLIIPGALIVVGALVVARVLFVPGGVTIDDLLTAQGPRLAAWRAGGGAGALAVRAADPARSPPSGSAGSRSRGPSDARKASDGVIERGAASSSAEWNWRALRVHTAA